ncbi:winged helix DNA-binding domain-containing protein [soil metagenome]
MSELSVEVSAGQLNRATLERQLLMRRERLPVADAVRRVVALQAQEPASPYLALWSRVADFDPAQLDAAFAAHQVVKATTLRVTLHAMHADDYPVFHEAMQRTLRAARFQDGRFTAAGLSVAEVEALLPEILEYTGQPRSNAEMELWLDRRIGRRVERPGLWWALRQVGPFVHAPIGGPWSFGTRPAYVAARRQDRAGDPEASMRGLIRRYLAGFGPATLADICQFMLLYKSWARPILDAMAGDLVRLKGPGRDEHFDLPGLRLPDEGTPAPPRLLPMWDNLLLAYSDRSRVIPGQYRKAVTRSNGDVLPTLLVDGYVAGVWRPLDGGIEATAFHRLSDDAWSGLATEARGLRSFLAEREPEVYRRYARWWADLPAAEVRLLS